MKRVGEWLALQLREITRSGDPQITKPHNKQFLAACLLIFFLALGVRLLTWHDLRLDVWRVQTYVTSDYKYSAYLLARRDFKGFLYDINRMGHPHGYPIVLAGIFKVWGDSDDAIQLVQVVCDSLAALVVFMIVFELLPFGVAVIAGLLTALSPQFSYHSVLLLPDSLAVLPILLAVYLIVWSFKRPRFLTFLLAGALIGISCWLRANALLLAPFLAICLAFLSQRGLRLRFATAFLAGALAIIVPVTIKNWVVFGHFVPLSLGAGQTLLEGIADYDTEKRLGIPQTDLGIMRQEAEWYQRPEYALLLFGPDGIKRERMRIARGFAVIRSRPLWFLGVMGRRALASLKLDRVPLVATEAPVTQRLEAADNLTPVWTRAPNQLLEEGSVASRNAVIELVDENRMLRLVGDETKYGSQIVSPPIAVNPDRDYVFRLPLKLEEGRALLKVTDLDPNATQQKALAASVIDIAEGVAPSEQALKRVELPFVSGNHTEVRLVFANNASAPGPPVARLGTIELYELGPSAYQWTRVPRFVIRNLQRFFLTAWMLPLTVFGIVILLRAQRRHTVFLLLSVPLYYLLVQSALHTERRYVIAIHYFFTMFAGAFLWMLFGLLREGLRRLTRKPEPA
ncbi:MAG: glycosyltransferase family 39 protein [Acidobacteriota bacterium]|nr:glycosyltransferase family 39 protein [Acidobacteriota bacterium]